VRLAPALRASLERLDRSLDSRPGRELSMFTYYPNPIVSLILLVLDLYKWVVIVAVIVSWLVIFRVINVSVPAVRQALRFLDALTEPVFRQVRRVVPAVGGFDLSPLIVLIAIWFLQQVVIWVAVRFSF
jgi:YggT family protein